MLQSWKGRRMTVIVGLIHNDTIYMGADSAGTANDHRQLLRADEKLFRKGSYLIGYSSSYRAGQVLRYKIELPAPPDENNLHRFMVCEFVEALRKGGKEYGSGKDESSAGSFLVACRGQLFSIEGDYQVSRAAALFDAIGSGGQIAMGALYATGGMPPMKRVRVALEAAAGHNATVRPPFIIKTQKGMR